jgi:hypothetical protein
MEAWTAAAIVTGAGMCVIEDITANQGLAKVPGRIVLMTPGEIAWDGCDCGQFAQSLQADYPSGIFPQDTSQQPLRGGGCQASPLAFQVLATIARCVPGITGTPPRPPTPASLLQAALQAELDAFDLRNGIECCLADMKRTLRIIDYRVGRVDKAGPEGNCAAVAMQYWFLLD